MKNRKSKNIPPRLGKMILKSLCSYDFLSTALWDLEEIHAYNLKRKGKFRADIRYILDALAVVYHLYFKGKSQYAPNRIAMLKNNFIVSIRSLKKDRAYSLINILGLSIGLSAFIMIAMFVDDELSYDRFHDNYESIYRMSYQVNESIGTFESARNISLSIPPLVKERVPEIQSYTRYVKHWETLIKFGEKMFYEPGGYYVEDSFFDFFHFPVIAGNLDGVFSDPKAMIITESMAEKYFGNEYAIGKVMTLNKNDFRKVVAVVGDPPHNTQFQFRFLLSLSSLKKFTNGNWIRSSGHAFFKLNAKDLEAIVSKVDVLKNESFPERYNDERAEQRNLPPSVFRLQPLADIHLQSPVASESSGMRDIQYMYIFSAIGLVILVIACVNYTNAVVARSINRVKEVGIRKAIGATKLALLRLYLTETVLYVLASVVLSIGIISWLLPYYNQFLDKSLSLSATSMEFMAIVSGIILLMTVLSGFYPAILLSRMSTVGALKGESQQGRAGLVKKGLISFQFFISQALIIVTVIIQSQLSYLQNSDIGYDREQLIYIPTKGELKKNYAAFKNEINAIPSVQKSAYIYNLLGSGEMTAFSMNQFEGLEDQGDDYLPVNFYQVTRSYIETMGMEIVEGDNFTSDRQKGFIINQAFARKIGWENPVGKVINQRPGSPGNELPDPIIGVLSDFNDQSMKSEIKPVLLMVSPDSVANNFLIARLSPQDMNGTLSAIEKVWYNHVSDRPFVFTFYDEQINRQYNTEMRLGKMFNVFTGLAIGICVLGILGLSAFFVEHRMKEFSIRKVLGASIRQLALIVNKGFVLPIIIAFVLAAPLTYFWVAERWLESFAYRIDIQPWMFIVAIGGTLLLTVMTVSYRSYKLKKVNPIRYLGSE